MYSVSSSMKLSLIVCCVFSIVNGPRKYRPPTVAASQFLLSQYYCYWVPATKASWCAIHQASLLSLLQVHNSPIFSVAPSTSVAPIFTIADSSSAPFTNLHCCTFYKCCTHRHCCLFYSCTVLVLFHLLATILCHVIMLLDNSTLSTILQPMWI